MATFKTKMTSTEEVFRSHTGGGIPGKDGLSAYELAMQEGFEGTLEEWLESLRGEPGPRGEPGAKGDPGYSPVRGKDYWTSDDQQAVVDDVLETEMFQQIQKDLADLKYVPIAFTGISNNVGTVEIGQVIANVTVSWALNKTPAAQTVEGEAVDVTARSKTISGLSVTSNKSFTVSATDERNKTVSASTGIGFLNGVYYGVLGDGATIDSAAVLSLTRKLQGNKEMVFTANPEGAQRIAYALPVRYGEPTFTVGGFTGGFALAEEFSFVNGSGYEEQYAVWLSNQTNLGKTTVTVT